MQTISPLALHERLQVNPALRLLDVRTPVEFAEVHVPAAINEPLDRLEAQKLEARRWSKDEPVYLLCRTGTRATKAAGRLEAAGFTQVSVVEGGTLAWDAAGLPVQRSGVKVMSLERQVRIVAGSLVLVGVILGWWVHPGFFGLAAFVGAGLVFAGITDFCGMGLLLAKLPWNNRPVHETTGKPARAT